MKTNRRKNEKKKGKVQKERKKDKIERKYVEIKRVINN